MSFIRPSSDEQNLLKNLLAYGFDYASSLSTYYKSNSLFKFSQLLLSFYQNYNRGQELLQWAVSQQIQCTACVEELFREGSLATCLSYHYFHYDQMGTKYLHIIIAPLVQELMAHPLISKVEKVDTDADYNLELLFNFLEEFLERLITTVSNCPVHIRELFLFFKKKSESKFTEAKVVVSSILFLRFLMPALISPHQFGIWHEVPSCQKGLILAARILQSIANMCEVEQFKWSNYSKLNCFIVRMFPKMEEFLNLLLNEKKIQKGKIILESSVVFKPNLGEREASLRDLKRFIESFDDKQPMSLPRAVLSNRRKTPEEMQRRLIELNLDENWKLMKTKKNSNLYSLRSEETPLAIFKVVSEVECSHSDLFNYLWKPEEISDVEVDYYQAFNFPFPISRRDMTYKCYGIQGGNVSTSLITIPRYSISEKEYPTRKGYTRIDAHVNGYIIEPIDTLKCKLTCINYLDLKGNIPLWLKNLVGMNLLTTPLRIFKEILKDIAKWCIEHNMPL